MKEKKLTKKPILSKFDVEHVAELARLGLSVKEKERYRKQLADILEYVEKLKEIDTESVEPTYQVTGLTNVFREDEPKPSLTQEEALSNAPETLRGYFKVKAFLEKE